MPRPATPVTLIAPVNGGRESCPGVARLEALVALQWARGKRLYPRRYPAHFQSATVRQLSGGRGGALRPRRTQPRRASPYLSHLYIDGGAPFNCSQGRDKLLPVYKLVQTCNTQIGAFNGLTPLHSFWREPLVVIGEVGPGCAIFPGDL